MNAKLKNLVKLWLIIGLSFSLAGCGSFGRKMKAFLGGKPAPQKAAGARPQHKSGSFNKNPQMYTGPTRRYKRMTQKKIEEQSAVSDRTGSLWVMEGQGSYLFSQNIIRMIGDPIAIKLDGDPKKQLESKVDIIKKLLAKLKARQDRRRRRVASESAKEKKKANGEKKPAKKNGPVAKKSEQDKELDESKFSIKFVPTRIVERLVDGNYRVKGNQPFLIGNREYKAIVTGIIRAEDFSEEGISASKLIDSKFDIVSVRSRSKSL